MTYKKEVKAINDMFSMPKIKGRRKISMSTYCLLSRLIHNEIENELNYQLSHKDKNKTYIEELIRAEAELCLATDQDGLDLFISKENLETVKKEVDYYWRIYSSNENNK